MSDDYTSNRQTTGAVAVGGSATGEVESSGDRDWFAVTLEAGTTYRIELRGARTGDGTLSDPYLRGVYDASGNPIAGTADDDGGRGRNSLVFFEAQSAGTYYIAAGADGGDTGTYRLAVTRLADDHPADTGTTGTVAVGGSAAGKIETPHDRDWFAVVLEAGVRYRVDLEGKDTDAGTLWDPYLHGVYDAGGTPIADTADNDTGVGANSRLIFDAERAGTYYIAAGANHSDTGTYRVSVTDVTDDHPESPATTGAVAVGGSATGAVETAGDHDWFEVVLEAGKTYRVDLEGADTDAGTLSDPRLHGVYDADEDRVYGLTIIRDDGGVGRNSVLVFAPEVSGTYYIGAAAARGATGTYRVSVRELADDHPADTGTTGTVAVGGSATGEVEFANDMDWFAVVLDAGTVYRIDLEGADTDAGTLGNPYLRGVYDAAGLWVSGTHSDDGGTGGNSRLFFEPEASGTYYLGAGTMSGTMWSETGTYRVSVTEVGDDEPGGAGPIGTLAEGDSARGAIERSGERDWFAVVLEAGTAYRLDAAGVDAGTPGAVHVSGVYDADGTLIAGAGAAEGGAGGAARHAGGASEASGIRSGGGDKDDGGESASGELDFAPAADGTYYVAVDTQGGFRGDYRISMSRVDDDYTADTDTTGTVSVGGTATGRIDYEGDSDWFAVTLEADKLYRIDQIAKDVANPDTYLRGIHDADGDLIAGTTDDDGGRGWNSRLYFTPEEAGIYYVAASTWSGRGTYTLSVTEVEDDHPAGTGTTGTVAVDGSARGEVQFPHDQDWFEVALDAGKTYRIDLEGRDPEGRPTEAGTLHNPYLRGVHDAHGVLVAGTTNDDGGVGYNARLYFTPDETGTYYVAAGAYYVGATGTYTLSVTDVTDDHPADTDTTGTVAVGGSATGAIETADDRDWFKVTLEADKTYRIDLEGRATWDGTLRDPYLRGVHDADGDLIAGTTDDDGGPGLNSRLYFTPDEAGTYYVAADAGGDGIGTYTLSVTDVTDDDHPADTDTTGTVSVGGKATGEIEKPADRDWFKVTLEADKTYRIDLEGRATEAGTLRDPYLRGVHDADGDLIAGTTDNNGGFYLNSRLYFAPEEAGPHYVAAGAGGDGVGTYTLSVTDVTELFADDDYTADTDTTGTVSVGGSATGEIGYEDDRDWFKVTLEAGKTYRIDLEGSSTEDGTLKLPWLFGVYDTSGDYVSGTRVVGVGLNSRVFFESDTAGTYYIATGTSGRDSTGTYTLSVTETEDDHPAGTITTGTVAIGGSATGNVDYVGDRDWFAVELEAGKTYRIYLEGSSTGDGTLRDPYLRGVHDADGVLIAGTTDDDGGPGLNSRLSFTADKAGTYYVAAGAYRGREGTYTLSVTEKADGLRDDDDYAAGIGTRGKVAVGGRTVGGIDYSGDRDWFVVTLEAGTRYRIDLEGGSLFDPFLHGVHDADGALIADAWDNNGGVGKNSRLYFIPNEAGTYYVEAGGNLTYHGTYTLSVTKAKDDHPAGTGTTGTVAVGGSATGEIDYEDDRDWFAVILEADTTYRIDLEGQATGAGSLRDPYLRGIHDADGVLIPGTTDYGGGVGTNSRLFFQPETAGTYYVAAGVKSHWSYGTYTLSVTEDADGLRDDDYAAGTGTSATVAVGGTAAGEIETRRDRDWFEVTLDAGKTYQIDLEGDATEKGTLSDPYLRGIHDADGVLIPDTTDYDGGVGTNSRLFFQPQTGGTYYIAAGAWGNGEGTYTVSVTEVEDDHPAGTGTTGTVAVGGSATGEIDYKDDRDWFAVTLEAGKRYRIDLEGADTRTGTLGDPYLHGVHDANGVLVAGTTNDDSGFGLNSRLTFEPETGGGYYIAAGAYGSGEGTYTLSVEEAI